jgi:hypothetical protein
LIALLAGGNWWLAFGGAPRPLHDARWPVDEATYAVDGWTTGAAEVLNPGGGSIVLRRYDGPDGLHATLVLRSSPAAKHIYRSGAEVPFLGAGYGVSAMPSDLAPPPRYRGLLAWREDQGFLVLHVYGDRRGLQEGSVVSWAAAILDAIQDQPNDYFQASLLFTLDRPIERVWPLADALASELFPRLAGWYAAPVVGAVADSG